jgi:DNA-binding transcriptional LysR family regulator
MLNLTHLKVIQRVGRGIRLTPDGELLAGRAKEILGRVDCDREGRLIT